MAIDLLSSTSYIETPFILATINSYTFGVYNKQELKEKSLYSDYTSFVSTYPNYIDSLQVEKVNGSFNTYNLKLVYAVTQGDDPNLIDKILGTANTNRSIKLSYGDLSIPSYIYKEEEAFITKVTSNIDVASSVLTYNLTCISKSLSLAAGVTSYPKVEAQPSTIIEDLLYNNENGLLDIFYGMRNRKLVANKTLIAKDDKKVIIEAQPSITPINYLKYLVECMTDSDSDDEDIVNKTKYTITFFDDIKNEYNGPYFKVTKVTKNISELNTYTVDIGYPGQNIVTAFNVLDDETYSILYNYTGSLQQNKYRYRINDDGIIESKYSPSLTTSKGLYKTTASSKNWWTQVTQYPISATLTIKGLLRPTILMNYLKVNVWFFGRKHISSGIYIITKQVDTINSSGYRTQLSLTRIGGVSLDDY